MGIGGLRPRRSIPLPNHNNTIWIDETPFNQGQHRKRGRSPKGKPARKKQKVMKGPNISILAAITPTKGLIHYQTFKGKQEKEGDSTRNFTKFIQLIYNKLDNDMKTQINYWIMD